MMPDLSYLLLTCDGGWIRDQYLPYYKYLKLPRPIRECEVRELDVEEQALNELVTELDEEDIRVFTALFTEMNGTEVVNSTKSCPTSSLCKLSPPSNATKVGLITAYVVVMVLAVLGNSLIIYIVRTKKRLRKVPFNSLIVCMAAADILDALITPPSSIWYLLRGNVWFGGIGGLISCKLIPFLVMISLCASIFTLTVIALDRYTAIVHVMKKPFSTKAVKLAAIASWLLAAAVSAPYLYRFKIIEKPDGIFECNAQWAKDPVKNHKIGVYESTARFIFIYAVPLCLLAILYSAIVYVLRQRRALVENVSQKRIRHQNRTVIKMLVTLVLLFAFCWLPVNVMSFLVSHDREVLQCIPMSFILFTYWLGHANSAINPCLYVIFNENFRKGLIECLCGWQMVRGQRRRDTQAKTTGHQNPACDAEHPEGQSRGTALTDGTVDTRL